MLLWLGFLCACSSSDEDNENLLLPNNNEDEVRNDEVYNTEQAMFSLLGKWQLVKYGGIDTMNDHTFFYFNEDGKVLQDYRKDYPDYNNKKYNYMIIDAWESKENTKSLEGCLLCEGWLFTDTLYFLLDNDNLVLHPNDEPGVVYAIDPNYYFKKIND